MKRGRKTATFIYAASLLLNRVVLQEKKENEYEEELSIVKYGNQKEAYWLSPSSLTILLIDACLYI
jgi:hypothetical protein